MKNWSLHLKMMVSHVKIHTLQMKTCILLVKMALLQMG